MVTATPPFVQRGKGHEQGGMQHGCHSDGAHEVKEGHSSSLDLESNIYYDNSC